MTPKDPPAEVRQASLFATPLAKLYELQDAYEQDKKLVKELEEDYPMDLEDLMSSYSDLGKQIKERKEEFLKDLSENSEEYGRARAQAAQTKIDLDAAVITVRQMADDETRQNGDIDQTIEVNGEIVRFQTQKTTSVDVFLNGKEL